MLDDQKNMIKAKMKKIGKKIIVGALIFIICIGAFLGIFMSLSNKMKDLYSTLTNFNDNVLEFLGKDNWIDLNEKIEREVNGVVKKQTIVDHYIEELSSMGIPLEKLNLLGYDEGIDYNDPNLFQNEENKKKVQKYIEEFLRADIISRQIHRTKGTKNVQSYQHENLIDGGVYIYRTKNEDEDTDESIRKKEKEIYRMEYMQYDEFLELQNTVTDNMSDSKIQKLEECFTLDSFTQELLFYKVDVQEYEKKEYNVGTVEKHKTVSLNLERFDYQQEIAEYTLPYEFLINLCFVTQNPEFVYHVAHLARETKINLLIQDNLTITETTEITNGNLIEEWSRKTVSNGNVGSTTASGRENLGYTENLVEVYKKDIIDVPYVKVMKVDAWSSALQNKYINKIEKNETEQQVNIGRVNLGYQKTIPEFSGSNYVGQQTQVAETYYTYHGEGCVKKVNEKVISNTYEEVPVVDKVRKSKQFLGLLRNANGKCPYDCYEHNSYVENCVAEAVFVKSGTNVEYRIPYTTRKECPLNLLQSGEKLLYLSLDNTITENNQEDTSGYTERMQGLKEYVQYLLTFPPNEEIDGLLDDEEIGNPNDTNDEDYEEEDNNIITPTELKKFFPNGLPQTAFDMQQYLVTIEVPINNKDGTEGTRKVTVHKAVANDVKAIFQKIKDSGFKAYDIQGFSWRQTSTNTGTRSHHSYGLAIDINVTENYCIKNGKVVAGSYWRPGIDEYSIEANGPVTKAFKEKGWSWGGNWKSSKDYMHFSVTGK